MADQIPDRTKIYVPEVTLGDILANVLGDNHSVKITRQLALKIFKVTSNQHTVFIQTRTEEDVEMELPTLWQYHAWAVSLEKWRAAKARQDRERDRGYIRDANIRNLSRCIRKKMLLKQEQADALARQAVDAKNHLAFQFYGLTKLITKVEEI